MEGLTLTALIPTLRPCMVSGHVGGGGGGRIGMSLCGQHTHLASPFDRCLGLRADSSLQSFFIFPLLTQIFILAESQPALIFLI